VGDTVRQSGKRNSGMLRERCKGRGSVVQKLCLQDSPKVCAPMHMSWCTWISIGFSCESFGFNGEDDRREDSDEEMPDALN
jgi:hypothetical protein